jgi:uncharacterized protein
MGGELRGPLPIKVDATSNGEFRPVPLTEPVARANREAEFRIGENAKRVGIGRRAFLQSLCGAATTLLTLNEAFAALGNIGGLFRLPKESAFETATAGDALAGDEFIFDVQTHLVDPAGAWRSSAGKYWEQILANFPQGSCGSDDPVDCFSAEKFIKHVFMDSDTELASSTRQRGTCTRSNALPADSHNRHKESAWYEALAALMSGDEKCPQILHQRR